VYVVTIGHSGIKPYTSIPGHVVPGNFAGKHNCTLINGHVILILKIKIPSLPLMLFKAAVLDHTRFENKEICFVIS
jgi:hypothetical protein